MVLVSIQGGNSQYGGRILGIGGFAYTVCQVGSLMDTMSDCDGKKGKGGYRWNVNGRISIHAHHGVRHDQDSETR